MNIAAFFDLDGTLVRPPSLEKRFIRYLRWRGAIGWKSFARCAAPVLCETCRVIFSGDPGGIQCIVAQCKAYLAGVPTAAMDAWLAWLARHPIEPLPNALRRLEWHAQQGHRIFLLSGTLEPLAHAVAQCISVSVEVCATQLDTERGRFTGRLCGEAVCGPAKARAMELLAARFSLDLSHSFAYGDSFADRWMLARVGHPFVVQFANKYSRRLARLAQKRRWSILRWDAAKREAGKIQRRGAEFAEQRREKQNMVAAQVKCR